MGIVKEYIYENEYLMKYIKDKELAYNIGSSSSKKILWICPNCNTEKLGVVGKVKLRGFKCSVCSDNTSYSERLMNVLLRENRIKYKTQVTFERCISKGKLPFDFGIYDSKGLLYLVEMQGEQHYSIHKNSHWIDSNVKEHDAIKRNFCKGENISLITIDASKSDFNFITSNIKNSEIGYLIQDVDLELLERKTLVREEFIDIESLLDLHDKGVSFLRMEKYLGISRKKIVSILTKLGEYNPRQGSKNNSRAVVCLNNNYVFNRMDEAIKYLGLKQQSNLTAVCRGKRNFCGKVSGEPAKWMYYDEYIEQYGHKGLTCHLDI